MSSSDTTSSRLDALRNSGRQAGTAFQAAVDTQVKSKDKLQRGVQTSREMEASVKDNPFFKIISNPDLSNEEKVALVRKVLTFNRDQTKEENQERINMLNRLEEYLEAQRSGHAIQLIDLNGSDVYPQLKNTIGQILDEFHKFQDELGTITGPLKTIEEIRSAGGKEEVLAALQKANESKRLGDELNAQVRALESEELRLKGERSGAVSTATQLSRVQEVEKSKKVRNFFSKTFGGTSYTAIVEREQQIETNRLRAEELSADLEAKRTALAEQLKNLQQLDEILAADPTQKKVQDLIDIGTASYQKRVDELKDSAKAFITFTRENLEICVKRLKLSGIHIDSLETANETYTQYYGLLSQGNREAMADNVKFDESLKSELKELEAGNPDDAKVQIRTMEVKAMTSNVNDFVTKQQIVSQTHSVVRNNLAEQQTAIIALKRNNNVAMQKATINLNNGVSTAATHFATVLVAINSAATAEASEQIGETFGAVRKMTQDTLESVLGRIIDDISSGRAEIAEQSEGIRKLAGTLSGINENLLSEIKDTLVTLDEADASNKELASIARKNRAVETDANREHSSGVASSTPSGKPAGGPDRFGLNI